MIRVSLLVAAIAVAAVFAQPPQKVAATVAVSNRPPVTASAVLSGLELAFDGTLAAIDSNRPVDLLGGTHGVYLADYGVVFTAELSLMATTPISPWHKEITDTERAQVHKQKLERLPKVIDAMKLMVNRSAATLEGKMPDNQQVVLAVRVRYLMWEDTTGLPTRQILMRADRKAASQGDIKTEIE